VRKLERCVVAVLLLVSASAALPQGPAWPVKPIHIVASVLPDLPTTLEAGFPDSDYNFWVGLFAPARTPGIKPN
jgi:hypothetical protein